MVAVGAAATLREAQEAGAEKPREAAAAEEEAARRKEAAEAEELLMYVAPATQVDRAAHGWLISPLPRYGVCGPTVPEQ